MTVTASRLNAGSAPPSGVTFEVVTIDAKMAAKMLAENIDNRPLRDGHVEELVRDARNQNFLFTGDPIQFDWNGVMINGQHRLHSIIRTGIPQQILVIRGLDPAVKKVIDTGSRRSAGDALHWSGIPDGSRVATVARVAMHREAGRIQTAFAWKAERLPTLTNSEIVDWIESHPSIVDATKRMRAEIKAIPGMSGAAWGYILWVLGKTDEVAYEEFVDALINLRTDGPFDPRNKLMKWLDATSKARHQSVRTSEALFVVFKTWNLWRRQETAPRSFVLESKTSAGADIPEPI